MLGISLYSLISIALLVTIFRMPAIALAPLFCMFGLEQWAQSMTAFFTIYGEFTNVWVGVLVIFGLLTSGMANRQGVPPRIPVVAYFVLALFFYALISSTWAPQSDFLLGAWMHNAPYQVLFIGLAPLLIKSQNDMKTATSGLLVLGIVLVIFTLTLSDWNGRFIVLKGISGYGGPDSGYVGGNPLAIAQMAGYVALAALFVTSSKETHILRWPFKLAVIILCLIIIAKSGSRGQFFALLLVGGLFQFFQIHGGTIQRLGITVLVIAVLAVIGGWVLTDYADSTRWSVSGLTLSGEQRGKMIMTLLAHWYSTPTTMLFGLGNSAAASPEIIGFYPHNLPVEILCEEGVIGFILFLVVIVLTLVSLRRMYLAIGPDMERRGIVSLLGAMFFFDFFLTLKQGSLLTHYGIFALAVLIGRYEALVSTGWKLERIKRLRAVQQELS